MALKQPVCSDEKVTREGLDERARKVIKDLTTWFKENGSLNTIIPQRIKMWNLPEPILSGQLPLSESDNYWVRMDSFFEVNFGPDHFRFAILAVAGRKGKPETDFDILYALDSNNGNIGAGRVENILAPLDEDSGDEAVLIFEQAVQLLEGLESPPQLNEG